MRSADTAFVMCERAPTARSMSSRMNRTASSGNSCRAALRSDPDAALRDLERRTPPRGPGVTRNEGFCPLFSHSGSLLITNHDQREAAGGKKGERAAAGIRTEPAPILARETGSGVCGPGSSRRGDRTPLSAGISGFHQFADRRNRPDGSRETKNGPLVRSARGTVEKSMAAAVEGGATTLPHRVHIHALRPALALGSVRRKRPFRDCRFPRCTSARRARGNTAFRSTSFARRSSHDTLRAGPRHPR